jgi:glycosyltransferase involved in cell wall biosynthesis
MLSYLENFNRVGKAHLGCVFYEDNENNRIGLPNRAFEYMFSGIAILGDDFQEIRRLIEETECGVIVRSEDPESLADSIEQIASRPEFLTSLGNNGRKAVLDHYNFEAALNKLELFYKEILADAGKN